MDLESQDQLCTYFLDRIQNSEENIEKANHNLNHLKKLTGHATIANANKDVADEKKFLSDNGAQLKSNSSETTRNGILSYIVTLQQIKKHLGFYAYLTEFTT